MESWMIGGIVGGIVGGLVGGLAVLIKGLSGPPPKCPDCGEPLPKVRKPANKRQMLWGGWTCPECGCEVDRKGKKIETDDD